jgi:hypothetical protein
VRRSSPTGDIAAHKYTLSSESRVAALGQGLGELEARGERVTGIVMHPMSRPASS